MDDAIKVLNIQRCNFNLLLSDAARYMTAAGSFLKTLYPKLFHITCMAHLWHNCSMRVKAHYNSVDFLIASVKAATVKNKKRKNMFTRAGIPQPPQPVITRWATWLKAAIYYANYLPEIKAIVNDFQGSGKIVENAKDAVSNVNLAQDLMLIQKCYSCLIKYVEDSESVNYSIEDGYKTLQTVDFGSDPCEINKYIEKRVAAKTDMIAIIECSKDNTSPTMYALLQKCQSTSVSVERSFSMLTKLLAKDRPFLEENITHYLTIHYNSVN